MRVVGLSRAFHYLYRRRPILLSPKAQERLRWLRSFGVLRKQGLSSIQAGQTLFIPRSTLPSDAERPQDANVLPLAEEAQRRRAQGVGMEEP